MAYRILNIDAWADGEDGWTWNNWHKIGTLETLPDEEKVIDILISEGFLTSKAKTSCYVSDDQYNLVVCDSETHEPLIAIEYGNVDEGE